MSEALEPEFRGRIVLGEFFRDAHRSPHPPPFMSPQHNPVPVTYVPAQAY